MWEVVSSSAPHLENSLSIDRPSSSCSLFANSCSSLDFNFSFSCKIPVAHCDAGHAFCSIPVCRTGSWKTASYFSQISTLAMTEKLADCCLCDMQCPVQFSLRYKEFLLKDKKYILMLLCDKSY